MRLAPLLLLLAASASAQVEYRYDDLSDNTTSGNIGPPASFGTPDMLWGNYFVTETGGEVITELSVSLDPARFPSNGNPITMWLLDDADGDLDPRNAVAVASAVLPGPISAEQFYSVEIPPTLVGAAFFVGVNVRVIGGTDRPAKLDNNAPVNNRSWLFFDDAIAPIIDDLASAAYGIRADGAFPGAFLVRAVGQPLTVAAEAPPAEARTLAAFPNPVRSASTLRYTVRASGPVTLTVHDALGRTVATLAHGERAEGEHHARLDASGLAPGVYVARLVADGRTEALRLVVAR